MHCRHVDGKPTRSLAALGIGQLLDCSRYDEYGGQGVEAVLPGVNYHHSPLAAIAEAASETTAAAPVLPSPMCIRRPCR